MNGVSSEFIIGAVLVNQLDYEKYWYCCYDLSKSTKRSMLDTVLPS